MERSWWWKALLYGALVALAALYLVPTVVPEASQPAVIKKYFQKRIQLGLDLQGGLHLVYEVHVDKAVSDKVDRIASEIEDRIKKDDNKKEDKDNAKKTSGVAINREGATRSSPSSATRPRTSSSTTTCCASSASSSTWSAATPSRGWFA